MAVKGAAAHTSCYVDVSWAALLPTESIMFRNLSICPCLPPWGLQIENVIHYPSFYVRRMVSLHNVIN